MRHGLRSFVREQRGFTGAEKAMIACFALAVIVVAGGLVRRGSEAAAKDAQRTLIEQAGGGGAISVAGTVRSAGAIQSAGAPAQPGSRFSALMRFSSDNPGAPEAAPPSPPPPQGREAPGRSLINSVNLGAPPAAQQPQAQAQPQRTRFSLFGGRPQRPLVGDDRLRRQERQRAVSVRDFEQLRNELARAPAGHFYFYDESTRTWYYKNDDALLRIEGFRPDGTPEAARYVGQRPGVGGRWDLFPLATSPDLVVSGTSDGNVYTGGFPQGLRPGSLVVGVTQTYGGATSNWSLADTAVNDARSLGQLYQRYNGRPYDGSGRVIAHSAGSVAAERFVRDNGGTAYIFGTPMHAETRESLGGRTPAGRPWRVEIGNNAQDPVRDSWNNNWNLVSTHYDQHNYGGWQINDAGEIVQPRR